MAGKKEYEGKAEEMLKPIAERHGVVIYDVEYVKEGSDWYLRAYIDKEGGVTIQDCEAVSREMSDQLDAEDFISDPYIFEVSSPGLGRQLKKDRHFAYCIGSDVEVKLFEALEGEKEFAGTLKAFDKEHVIITGEKGDITFDRAKIAKVQLQLDF